MDLKSKAQKAAPHSERPEFRQNWWEFVKWLLLTLFVVLITFTVFGVLIPKSNMLKDLLSLNDWQNAGAGVALVFSTPIALAGSIVAIVLAQSALQVSRNQEHFEALNYVTPLLHEMEEYQWTLARHVDEVWDALQPLLSEIEFVGRFGRKQDFADAEKFRLVPSSEQAVKETALDMYQRLGVNFNKALDALQAHNRAASRFGPVRDVLSFEVQGVRSDERSCIRSAERYQTSRHGKLPEEWDVDAAQICELILPITPERIKEAIELSMAFKFPFIPGFPFPRNWLNLLPSKPELVSFIQLLGATIDGTNRSGFIGAAVLLEMVHAAGQPSTSSTVVRQHFETLGVWSERIDRIVSKRFDATDPSRYFRKNTTDLAKAARGHLTHPLIPAEQASRRGHLPGPRLGRTLP